jgi:DNA topoisomerase-1
MSNLLIVESAKKARTIKGMLGAGYTVKATGGHILDMPADDMHVDLEDFTPTLHLMRGKGKLLEALRAAAAAAGTVYLATDMDREGEAIAQHVAERLGQAAAGKIRRITFTAITQADLRAALAAPRDIDERLVEAQTARRVTDRLVGYMVSPVLWAGLSGLKRLSAGRVQSPALWLVVERERAILAFVPEEWWSIEAELSKTAAPEQGKFWAVLFKIKGQKPELRTEADARKIVDDLEGAAWRVLRVEKGTRQRRPYPPFTTDSLQQAASSQLGFNPRLTMKLAQELYEGLKLGEGKAVGLITYIRTDSMAVAPEAQAAAREVVAQFWGEIYLPAQPPIYQTRDKTAQEAHEAIRPTDPWRTPKAVEPYLTPQQGRLYRLIWRRFIASQMKPAVYNVTTVDVATSRDGKDLPYLFRASGRELLFEGFLKAYEVRDEKPTEEEGAVDQVLPPLSDGEPLVLHGLYPEQHFTKPPPHFTEASLIKELEKQGIGRPSTYASIVRTILQREYVERQKKSLLATELGYVVCDFLVAQFPDLFAVGFTARMEDELDGIARGEHGWVETLRAFYAPFSEAVDKAQETARTQTISAPAGESKRKAGSEANGKATPTGETCPECGGDLVERKGKRGVFWGCSNYPTCTHTQEPERAQ